MLKILKAFKTREQLLKQVFKKHDVKNAILNIDKNNIGFLKQNLKKFPDQMSKLRFKSKKIQEVIKNKTLQQDPALCQEIIFLWGQRAINCSDLESYIQHQIEIPHEFFDEDKLNKINTLFKKNMKDMNVQIIIGYLRYRSFIQKNFIHKDINELIAKKLQYEDQSQLFQEFYKIGFFSNNYIYSLIDLGLWDDLIQYTNKNDLYQKLVNNSIYLNQDLQKYFQDCNDTKETSIDQMIQQLENQQYYQQQLYLEGLKLQDLLQIKQVVFVEKKYELSLPLQLLQEVTKKKCVVENIIQNIEIIQHLVKQWNVVELEQVEDILDEFTNSLKTKIYSKINHTNYFFYILSFWDLMLKKNDFAKDFNYISNRGYQVLEYFCKNFTELFIEFCFTESINNNLESMDDVTYIEGRTYDIPYDVVKFEYTEKQIDQIIDVFLKFCEYNLGTQKQWELFNQFFEFYIMQLNQQQFSKVIFISSQVNIGIDKIQEKVLLYIQNLTQSSMNMETALSSAIFLTCTQNYQSQYWNILQNVIQKNMDNYSQINPQMLKQLYICKQIHKRKPENYLQSLQLDFHYENIIIDSTNFNKTLKYFFDHLFLEDIETNLVIDQVNVSFNQGKKALLALERKQITGFTYSPTGEAVLAQIFLRNFFTKIEILPITEFNEYEKNNDKMHFLRKKLIGWKTDQDAKREFYNKQIDFVEEKIHLKNL